MLRSVFVIALGLLLGACGSIPVRTAPVMVDSLPATGTGVLNSLSGEIGQGLAGGESAFWLLDRADLSYEVRLALVDAAVESLDIQYFIWEKDPTSRLYAHRVIQAADRGVRVRILLDDLTLSGQDGEFSALDSHPNISVRSFNPWKSRTRLGRVGEFFLNIDRLNHRMHNKIIVADGHFAILGGRNIGDRYFGAWDAFVQNDLDIMTAGPVIADLAESFDLYWNSDLSYSLTDFAKPAAAGQELDSTVEFLESTYRERADRLDMFPFETDTWDSLFDTIRADFSTGIGRLEYDLPDVESARPDQLVDPLLAMLASAERRVLLSTAYLIPDDEFFELLTDLEARGVEVTLLTNSLASNNHMVAHTGYRGWRKKLIDIGVDLFEARDDSMHITEYSLPLVEPEFLGLHSKSIVVDDSLSFVGSPNIDPRSLLINTEVGIFVESEELAARLAALIERDISPDAAWRVYRDDRGRLRWESSAGIVKNQPALGFLQRLKAFLIGLLPLKRQA